jgi:putative CocE/NonD family hydrolase
MIEYYTLGENRWKTAREWPLPQTKTQCLYLAADHQLRISMPTLKEGSDRYQVDPTAATGLNNRWHAQTAGKPILFPDRAENDKKLMVYDTSSLENDTEITGHPVVHLYIRSNATDGQFFVYLETVDPDGRVRMLTEGQLRGLHRKVSDDTPPYKMFGPYHSLKEKDALPLIPGEVAEIAFDLFPISVLLKKGQRIRLAIAGADADVFAPILGCESPALTVERNSVYASCIELPIIA